MTTQELGDRIGMRLANLVNLAAGEAVGTAGAGSHLEDWIASIDKAADEVERNVAAIMADVVYYAQQEGSR